VKNGGVWKGASCWGAEDVGGACLLQAIVQPWRRDALQWYCVMYKQRSSPANASLFSASLVLLQNTLARLPSSCWQHLCWGIACQHHLCLHASPAEGLVTRVPKPVTGRPRSRKPCRRAARAPPARPPADRAPCPCTARIVLALSPARRTTAARTAPSRPRRPP
jgi:hypothetical protein